MHILIVGSGGREHALGKSFFTHGHQISACPGNPGLAQMGECWESIPSPENPESFPKLARQIQENQVDLVVIGPEAPLANGLSDFLRGKNVPVFGPSQQGALLESSKIFAKKFMAKAQVPTAQFMEFHHVDEVLAAVKTHGDIFKAPYVLKADGLAAGKGVVICSDLEELKTHSKKFLPRLECRA